MSKADKILSRMRNNPRDWRIEDLERVASWLNMQMHRPASGSSHVIFSHPSTDLVASVPDHRPIKPRYVRNFLALVDIIEKG